MNIGEMNFTAMSNEDLRELMKVLEGEKKRREKIDKRTSAIDLRDALSRFIDTGANYDFGATCSLTVCDVDVIFDFDSDATEDDIRNIEFNAFNRAILLDIRNELERCIGNYEG